MLDGIPALDIYIYIYMGSDRRSFFTETRIRMIKNGGDPYKSPTRKKIYRQIDDLHNIDFVFSNVNSSRKEALLVNFEDKRSSDQDDHKGKKHHNETRFQNPQSCS